MGLRPTEGDEKQLPFSNYSPWKHRPPPCHPDRSEAQWRDLRFGGSPLEMFFDSEGCESPAHDWGSDVTLVIRSSVDVRSPTLRKVT